MESLSSSADAVPIDAGVIWLIFDNGDYYVKYNGRSLL